MDVDIPLENFLEPAPGIQCEAAEVVALAQDIVRGSTNDLDAAERLFVYVRDTVRYNARVPYEPLEAYLALNVLAQGEGFCIQKAALLCTLARAVGIPARMGFADIENHLLPEYFSEILVGKVLPYHSFTEWFVGGGWYKATPSFDAALTVEQGWRLVEFAPRENLLLPDTDLAGRPHIRYLRYRGWRYGVPYEELMREWTKEVGAARLEAWRKWSQPEEPA